MENVWFGPCELVHVDKNLASIKTGVHNVGVACFTRDWFDRRMVLIVGARWTSGAPAVHTRRRSSTFKAATLNMEGLQSSGGSSLYSKSILQPGVGVSDPLFYSHPPMRSWLDKPLEWEWSDRALGARVTSSVFACQHICVSRLDLSD